MDIDTSHPNCMKCGLYNTCAHPYMVSDGGDNPLVLVVGEAPNYEDDKYGTPFSGRNGNLVRSTLRDAGLDDNDIRYTYTVRCKPTAAIAKRVQNYCKHFLLEEIEYYNPKLVLLMGNTPLNAVLGESNISQWNGVIVEREERVYVPLYHPAYITHNMHVIGDWIDAIDGAIDVMLNGNDTTAYKIVYPRTLDEIYAMVDHLLLCDIVAYDTETGQLDPFHENNSIPCISFAGDGITYAIPLDHYDSWWDDEQYDIVLDAIRRILDHSNVVGHNIKFDQLHTMYMLNIDFIAYGDTMLVSHMLDSRQGIHKLKRLAGLYLGMYDYDKELQDYVEANKSCNPRLGGSYANIPLNILLPYAARDTEATLKLWHILIKELTPKQWNFYTQVIMQASNALRIVEYNGNKLDDHIVRRYAIIYQREQDMIYQRIMANNAVINAVNILQQEADTKIIQQLPSNSDVRVIGDYIVYGNQRKRKRNIITFNPNSPAHLRCLYFNVLDIKSDETTASGMLSTASGVMKPHIVKYPVVDDILYYKLLSKMLGTYLIPARDGIWKSGDGRVRSTYNLHGTRTGRLSSSNPNMQNIPTPEKEADTRPNSVIVKMPVKNMFTHTYENGMLVAVDYSGMELRVFASVAACTKMLAIHESGADFHSMVAIMATTGRSPEDITIDETRQFKHDFVEVRYRYKWTNWTLLYGGDKYTLMNLYGMSDREANDTVESYYRTFPEVLHFREQCIVFGQDNGYIESPFGRRERLHYINDDTDPGMRNKDRRSAVNMPVQSAASDILLCALIVIQDILLQRNMRTMIVNTVHDSIVLDAPYDEISEVANLCVDVMEHIVDYAKEYFPNIDFSWLLSPLKADVEVGTHYGDEYPYAEWMARNE